ncbi:hypothetical protein AB8806_23225 [Ralstonia syzygii subsp. celebesensis]
MEFPPPWFRVVVDVLLELLLILFIFPIQLVTRTKILAHPGSYSARAFRRF